MKKVCTKCNIEKETTEFSYGRMVCKICRATDQKEKRNTNKEKWSQIGKNCYNNHREKRLAEKRKYYQDNKESILAYGKLYRLNNPEKIRDNELRAHYNITLEQFNAILEQQGNKCAICETDTPDGQGCWHIDHDHRCCDTSCKSCGKCVRGIVCHSCNTGLGLLKDSIEILDKAKSYLEKWSNKSNESLYSRCIR